MRTILLTALVGATLGCEDLREGIDGAERDAFAEHALPAPPLDPSNRYDGDPRAEALGHRLFFDPRLSGALGPANDGRTGGSVGVDEETAKISCASCHDLTAGGADRRSQPAQSSLGSGWTTRNTPTVLNSAYSPLWQFWDGRSDSLWSQAIAAIEAGATHNFTRLGVAHVIFDHHRPEYEALFGPLPAELADTSTRGYPAAGRPGQPEFDQLPEAKKEVVNRIFVNVGKALAAFERTLVCKDSPFDRWLAGDDDALSATAIRGARLFRGRAACAECHSGPNFTDYRFHSTGTPQLGEHAAAVDEGRHAGIERVKASAFNRAGAYSDAPSDAHLAQLTASDADLGTFKTPTLRCVGLTAPYKHDGFYGTLRDVVLHYRAGGTSGPYVGQRGPQLRPLDLTDDDVSDLTAFLEALTGQPLPEELTRAP